MSIAAQVVQAPSPADDGSCKLCPRRLKNRAGLMVHMRRGHPREYHEDEIVKLQGRQTVKKRWDEQEMKELALAEARLMLSGPVAEINQKQRECTGSLRSIEAIKGKKRAPGYKKLVDELLLSLSSNPQQAVTAGNESDSIQPVTSHESNFDSGGLTQESKTGQPSSEGVLQDTLLVDLPPESEDIIYVNPAALLEDDIELDEEFDERPLEDSYHLNESTIIYDSIGLYIERLNSDARLRPAPLDDELQLLDSAL